MAAVKYPDGVKDYGEMVTKGYCFVDKTMMIRDVCEAEDKVILYTRPRRFGKSVNLSMLDYFFNIDYRGSPDMFAGRRITKECPECAEHRNAYPVIRMDFSRLSSFSVDEFRESLSDLVSLIATRVRRAISPDALNEDDARRLRKCADGGLKGMALNCAVADMCEILDNAYGRKVMLFVDEYDRCVQGLSDQDLYDGIVNSIRPFMEQTFKTNTHMRTGVVTGIMPLAKAGMLRASTTLSSATFSATRGTSTSGSPRGRWSGCSRRPGTTSPG
ncbi:MAG: AAA family ATPase [Candidatus Methanomethylophilaceae archaeon]|nr:AAA family ATPase [Candidatus Methanomethylophilaceae archaeon]